MELKDTFEVLSTEHSSKQPYNSNLKKVCTLKRYTELSHFLHHLDGFSQIPNQSICIFRKGIDPSWEDPSNKKGATYSATFSLSVGEVFFEKLMMYFCCLSFDKVTVNGIRINIRPGNCKIEVWTKEAVDGRIIIAEMKSVLEVGYDIEFTGRSNRSQLDQVNEKMSSSSK